MKIKKATSLAAVFMVMVLCIGVFAGCSDTTTTTSSESSTSSTDSTSDSSEAGDADDADAATQEDDVIGQVIYAGNSDSTYLTIAVYEPDETITDYTSLDSVTLSDASYQQRISLDSDAVYKYVASGEMFTTDQDDISEGDMIAVTTDDNGAQEIIILEYTVDDSSDSSDDSSSSDSSDASDSSASSEDSSDASSEDTEA